MARKVLISFLGTGPSELKNEGHRSMREYRHADYELEGKVYENYSFMAAALAEHYHVDQILMIGTVHSMWEELYRWFHDAKRNNKVEDSEADWNIYNDISNSCIAANHESRLEIPHMEEIERVMGKGSKVILVKYGIKEEEIKENINLVLGLKDFLQKGDELIVDITHSFRSLPIFIMNLLVYLQNVSSIGVRISHIHYGMLEIGGGKGKEMVNVPIVDLKSMMDVQEWITGAYNFQEFGNTYKIEKLLRAYPEKRYEKTANTLRNFADAKNFNHLNEFRNNTSALMAVRDVKSLPEIGRLIIPEIIDKFNKLQSNKNNSQYQLKMAEWHYDRYNYGYAAINLVESVLDFCCDLFPTKDRNFIRDVLSDNTRDKSEKEIKVMEDFRENYLKIHLNMRPQKINYGDFSTAYNTVNYIRNTIAHNLDRKSVKDMMKGLQDSLKYFKKVL